jgi:hypothetical protein
VGLRVLLIGGELAQAREEEGLVDPTVEDRDAQLETLHDHVSALQSGLTCKLSGRQVIGHRSSILLRRSLHADKYGGSAGRAQRFHPFFRALRPEIAANKAVLDGFD